MTSSLYSIRSTASGFLIAKFDSDFNISATYDLKPTLDSFAGVSCTCPAFHNRNKCKHGAMVNLFAKHDRLDSDWFYDNEAKTWSQPIANEPAIIPEGANILKVVGEALTREIETTLPIGPKTGEAIRRRI